MSMGVRVCVRVCVRACAFCTKRNLYNHAITLWLQKDEDFRKEKICISQQIENRKRSSMGYTIRVDPSQLSAG